MSALIKKRQQKHRVPIVIEEAYVEEENDEYGTSSDSDVESGDDQSGLEEDVVATRLHSTQGQDNIHTTTPPTNAASHIRTRRITITVEDASDSECEDEFDSPWRNLRPSPGQWIEPVEPYHG